MENPVQLETINLLRSHYKPCLLKFNCKFSLVFFFLLLLLGCTVSEVSFVADKKRPERR